MLGLCKTVFFLYILFIFVECSHPGSLSVRKLNRQLIARKRQNTLDLCQMFNNENERTQSELVKHNRVKRAAVTVSVPPTKTAERVEKIVDKLYDDEQDGGEKVAYRKNNQTNTTTTTETTTTPKPKASKSGRRFDFAPALLDSDILPTTNDTIPPNNEPEEEQTVPVPWLKYWRHGIVPYFIDSNTYGISAVDNASEIFTAHPIQVFKWEDAVLDPGLYRYTFLADKIRKAFDNFEQSTCIRLQRLREKPTDKASLKNVEWLYITNPSGTRQCVHSNEMKANSGVQWVVFGYDCMSEGQILHEIMHILGFSHEHVREDRDQYITVMWDNIKPGYKKFFKVQQRPRYAAILSSLPYDYASVLHYPPRAFSKNGKFTLMAEPGTTFGQRDGLSEIDAEKVTLIFSGECIERNKHYLVTTCPTVIASKEQKNAQTATQQEIDEYFKGRLWPYGIVNFKIKDKIEFSIEERQNIEEVIKHIEKETCIEFRDFNEDDDSVETTTVNDDVVKADDGNVIAVPGNHVVLDNKESPDDSDSSDSDKNKISDVDTDPNMKKLISAKRLRPRKGSRRFRRAVPASPARRHADNLLVLTRSSEPGCRCPEPGIVSSGKELAITADCFNSVNDLLHVFVHVLGLDHQHNSHDRDDFLAIDWANVTDALRAELDNKLPPAASVGFTYDYQSVMHYPWLDIKNGVTNIMYPIWNDGWSMGHWQGLSSIDVQKLNLLYFTQCQSRKKHLARTLKKQ